MPLATTFPINLGQLTDAELGQLLGALKNNFGIAPEQGSSQQNVAPKPPSTAGRLGQLTGMYAGQRLGSYLAGQAAGSGASQIAASQAAPQVANAVAPEAATSLSPYLANVGPLALALHNAYVVGQGIHRMTKSGKSGDQIARDKMRAAMQSLGLSDANNQMYGYNIGREGDSLKVDLANPVAAHSAEMLQPLGDILSRGGKDSRSSSMANLLANATANGADSATATQRIKDIYTKMGLSGANINQALQGVHDSAMARYGKLQHGVAALLSPGAAAQARKTFVREGYGLTPELAAKYRGIVSQLGLGGKSELAPMESHMPRGNATPAPQPTGGLNLPQFGDTSSYWGMVKNGQANFKDLARSGILSAGGFGRSMGKK